MKLIKIYLFICIVFTKSYANDPYKDLQSDTIALDNGRKNNPSLSSTNKTKLINDIDQIVCGNKYGINLNQSMTFDQKTLIKKSILTSWFSDPSRELNLIFYNKILIPNDVRYYCHLTALFVLNWASRFAAKNRSVLFYGQDGLVDKFVIELNNYIFNNKDKFNTRFLDYFKTIKTLNTFVNNVLSNEFIDLIFTLTNKYNDIQQPWTTDLYERLLAEKIFIKNRGLKIDQSDLNLVSKYEQLMKDGYFIFDNTEINLNKFDIASMLKNKHNCEYIRFDQTHTNNISNKIDFIFYVKDPDNFNNDLGRIYNYIQENSHNETNYNYNEALKELIHSTNENIAIIKMEQTIKLQDTNCEKLGRQINTINSLFSEFSNFLKETAQSVNNYSQNTSELRQTVDTIK